MDVAAGGAGGAGGGGLIKLKAEGNGAAVEEGAVAGVDDANASKLAWNIFVFAAAACGARVEEEKSSKSAADATGAGAGGFGAAIGGGARLWGGATAKETDEASFETGTATATCWGAGAGGAPLSSP